MLTGPEGRNGSELLYGYIQSYRHLEGSLVKRDAIKATTEHNEELYIIHLQRKEKVESQILNAKGGRKQIGL